MAMAKSKGPQPMVAKSKAVTEAVPKKSALSSQMYNDQLSSALYQGSRN